jgi:hypothetical protein
MKYLITLLLATGLWLATDRADARTVVSYVNGRIVVQWVPDYNPYYPPNVNPYYPPRPRYNPPCPHHPRPQPRVNPYPYNPYQPYHPYQPYGPRPTHHNHKRGCR